MKYTDDLILKSQQIVQQIQTAEKNNKPIDALVKKHIKILEVHHDEFVKQADETGVDNWERAKIEIQLYTRIKAWAAKIGLSTEKYDKAIKNIRVKCLGEEAVEKLFG
ncbi:MAG: hypothetical protein LBK53_03230 [Heliobacteriaceae bacterium]|jgi:hypothetical protein|nr:hypothetical protein [Heliobacteriaceae bacterium]